MIITTGKEGFPAPDKSHFDDPRASNIQKRRHLNRLATTGTITRFSAILVVCDSVAFQVIDGIFDGADVSSLIVGDFHLLFVGGELFFEGHN